MTDRNKDGLERYLRALDANRTKPEYKVIAASIVTAAAMIVEAIQDANEDNTHP